MAPVTRARRRRDSIPLVPVLDNPNSSHPASELPPPQLEDSTTPTATPSKPRKQKLADGTEKHIDSARNQSPPPPLPENEPTNATTVDSESDPDSDGEAPEAVSLDTGRETAKRAQDEAKQAAQAQADAVRKKRKARDAKLKEQKEEANERKMKRRKVNPEGEEGEADNTKALTIAGKPTELPAHEENAANPSPSSPPPPAEQQLTKTNLPTLLPETLLAEVATAKRRRHREPDSRPDPEPEQKKQVANTGIGGRNAERNRRKKQRQKLNRTLKKGPVSVKVLKDDTKSRKILPPPAAKIVGSIKDSWLFGRKAGGAMRRDVIAGFVRK